MSAALDFDTKMQNLAHFGLVGLSRTEGGGDPIDENNGENGYDATLRRRHDDEWSLFGHGRTPTAAVDNLTDQVVLAVAMATMGKS